MQPGQSLQSHLSHLRRAARQSLAQLRSSRRRGTITLAAIGLMLAAISVAVLWQHVVQTKATAGSPVGFVRFTDTRANTGFNVDVTATDPFAGEFTFITPSGAQYHGGQASDLQNNSDATITLRFNGDVQFIPPQGASGQNQDPTTARVLITATIDLSQHHATAELTDSTNRQHYVMVTTIPGGERQVVDAVDQAVIAQDWATLYGLTTLSDGAMTEAQFAQTMEQQVQTVGAITNIVVTSDPQVTTDSTGTTYFTVQEQVTLTLNGNATTQNMTMAFMLDNGSWRMWYSTTP